MRRFMVATLPVQRTRGAPARPRAWTGGDRLWLVFSLTVGLFFAFVASRQALGDPLVVQDDARKHLFWVARLVHPELFQHDLIADYYQSEVPLGFIGLWWLLAQAFDTIAASKIVPLILTPILGAFTYLLARHLTGRPLAAGLSTVLVSWCIWQYDDVASATPRAFATPLFAMFLYFLAVKRPIGWLATLVLQGLLYTPACAVMLGVLGLGWLVAIWPRRRVLWSAPLSAFRLSETRGLLIGLALALLLVGVQSARTRDYGGPISGAAAQTLPEFRQGGRQAFFITDPWTFWLKGRSGLLAFHVEHPGLPGVPVMAIPIGLTLLLLLWMLLGRLRRAPRPDVRGMGLVLQLLLSSVMLFGLAHLLLFRLYLPARQTQFSLPLVWSLAGGLFLALLAEALTWRLPRPAAASQALGLIAAIALVADHPPPADFYVEVQHPRVYAYLRQQPPDTLVAAQYPMASLVPLYGERSVLYSSEHAAPYQRVYYEQIRERQRDQDRAFASDSMAELVTFLDAYGVDVVVVHSTRAGEALDYAKEQCTAARERDVVALPSSCIRRLARVG
ncbi:MAG: hypothetical protein IT307_09585 [Chloroflexi bacterium]|nr:hypothetical protein [Chloroflexota bacterium]